MQGMLGAAREASRGSDRRKSSSERTLDVQQRSMQAQGGEEVSHRISAFEPHLR
jgi:hypothetical protein